MNGTKENGVPRPVLSRAMEKAGWNAPLTERRRAAFELRQMRKPYRVIAEELGISIGLAHKDVMAVLDALLPVEDAESLRRQEADNLDRLEAVLLDRMGKEPTLAIVDRVLAIQGRRAKLLGLDAPVKVAATHEVTVETATDRELREMVGQMRPDLDVRPDLV